MIDKETLCPFRMVGKIYVEDCRCIGSLCELWSKGFGRCSLRLLTLLPYIKDLLNGLQDRRKKIKRKS